MLQTPSKKIPRPFPPIPRSNSSIRLHKSNDDGQTVGTISTSPYSDYSEALTPSTKCSSPGRYAWSLSSKKRSLSVKGRTQSPFSKAQSSLPAWRNSPIKRYHSFNKSSRFHNYSICKTNSMSQLPHLIKNKMSESILDLTDSEDEVDSIVDNSSLRHLFQFTSQTLSPDRIVFEEDSFLELQPLENEGLKGEMIQLNQEECNSEMNTATDKTAYCHSFTSELRSREKLSSSNSVTCNIQEQNNDQVDEKYERITDKFIGLCICWK